MFIAPRRALKRPLLAGASKLVDDALYSITTTTSLLSASNTTLYHVHDRVSLPPEAQKLHCTIHRGLLTPASKLFRCPWTILHLSKPFLNMIGNVAGAVVALRWNIQGKRCKELTVGATYRYFNGNALQMRHQ